jgi:hypothetical protein
MTAQQQEQQEPQNKQQEARPQEVSVVPPPLEVLKEWQAPSRPYKKRDREYFTTIAAIVFLVSVILLFVKEWLLIAVIISLMFISYVLATVEPEKIKNAITTRGVRSEDKNYKWDDLDNFWFTEKWGHQVLNIQTLRTFPPKLQLLINGENKEEIKALMERYLIEQEPDKGPLDKAADWLKEKVPLETE